jgi:hypothetical protein
VKMLYTCAIALWLAYGLGLQAYFARAAHRPAAVEAKRDSSLRQPRGDDAVAQRIRTTQGQSGATVTAGYAAWAIVGFLLAIPGVRALFRMADRVGETEKFLAGTMRPKGTAGMPSPRQARPEGA